MQETRYTDPDDERIQKIRQAIFTGMDDADLKRQMDADVRPGETVVRRRALTPEEMRGMNRHERRKAQSIARHK